MAGRFWEVDALRGIAIVLMVCYHLIYDLDYFALIKDPIAAVEDIYRAFGIDFTADARAAMVRTHEESRQGPRAPKHTYSLADYGLTEEQVKEQFDGL